MSKRLRMRRLRLLVRACADDRTYVHTYIYPENRSRFILPRANALGNYACDPSARVRWIQAHAVHARVYIITRTEYAQKMADLATISK